MQIIEETLSRVKAGAGVSFNNLSVIPPVAAKGVEPDYLTLDDALSRAWREWFRGGVKRC